MKKNRRLRVAQLCVPLLVMSSFGFQVQAEVNGVEQFETQLDATMAAVSLPEPDTSSCQNTLDQINEPKGFLESKSDVRCYVFTSIRGQKVLLAAIAEEPESSWQVEYYDGVWKTKNNTSALDLPGLKPGDQVVMRVSYKQDKPYQRTEYKVAFGSYPVLKDASLSAPPVRNRVPVADSGWVAGLQTHGTLTFEATFTDTTGIPLKGASASLPIYLNLKSKDPEVTQSALSDERGIATATFTLNKCYGGELAAQRNDAGGTHHWVSTYNVGRWFVFDKLIGAESKDSESKKMAGFAHICTQTLNRGRI
ncbi:hypothetical protein [Pseudomonas syringae group sp. J309-1]|uniref:hypothetical protein n=1 Tax=Pseudomonas syringae group sp. J309-1 TaxID=3079588 RepID=UPI002906CB94|nr:hypothetical protein [Pseudomonas syringae group sp. J309-1]MDU8359879.1 hypothetical protein [Pseudomonas syringae group sp. J309-1]